MQVLHEHGFPLKDLNQGSWTELSPGTRTEPGNGSSNLLAGAAAGGVFMGQLGAGWSMWVLVFFSPVLCIKSLVLWRY